jgi:hypothetical protein
MTMERAKIVFFADGPVGQRAIQVAADYDPAIISAIVRLPVV